MLAPSAVIPLHTLLLMKFASVIDVQFPHTSDDALVLERRVLMLRPCLHVRLSLFVFLRSFEEYNADSTLVPCISWPVHPCADDVFLSLTGQQSAESRVNPSA